MNIDELEERLQVSHETVLGRHDQHRRILDLDRAERLRLGAGTARDQIVHRFEGFRRLRVRQRKHHRRDLVRLRQPSLSILTAKRCRPSNVGGAP